MVSERARMWIGVVWGAALMVVGLRLLTVDVALFVVVGTAAGVAGLGVVAIALKGYGAALRRGSRP